VAAPSRGIYLSIYLRIDEPVLQDGEWQQQQQVEVRGGGGDDEEHEEEEQPASGAEERGHAEETEPQRAR